jgi:Ca-activated chloride channel family protein
LASGESSSNDFSSTTIDGELVFSARVRMVNLSVAVSDAKGNPVPGLTAADFRVDEDAAAQRIGHIQDGDAAFNLALVLDMSGSSIAHREPIQAAARRFVEMARPGDRVAIYALTYGMFQVVSPLSTDRDALLDAVDNLPGIAGASPLFDIVTLAYTQELRQLPSERNALIVISDGLDNRITGGTGPSSVRFGDLERMAKEMNAIIYPVLLLSSGRQPVTGRFANRDRVLLAEAQRQAARQMEALAKASGGRVFPARSIEDLEPIFPLVESELRSVYTLGYYPANQDLDGAWRTVEVTVDKSDVTVRARPGYYAK